MFLSQLRVSASQTCLRRYVTPAHYWTSSNNRRTKISTEEVERAALILVRMGVERASMATARRDPFDLGAACRRVERLFSGEWRGDVRVVGGVDEHDSAWRDGADHREWSRRAEVGADQGVHQRWLIGEDGN